jgi:hypothetical protein
MRVTHTNTDRPSRGFGLRGLFAVNAALLVALAFMTFAAPSIAQYRAPGVYHGVSATASGFDSGVIVIVDESNQAMIGLAFDPNTGKFAPAGRRDLAADSMNLRSR